MADEFVLFGFREVEEDIKEQEWEKMSQHL